MKHAHVEKFYDANVSGEARRLDHYILEWDMTNRLIDEYITHPISILDLGGGPGKYSIRLAGKGHRVTLADIAKKNLDLARKNADRANVKLEGFFHVDAVDLSCFAESSFDAVLCLGPIYHLPRLSDRKKAIEESIRVLKTDGVLFVSFISTFGPLLDCLRYHPESITNKKNHLLEKLKRGTRSVNNHGPGFTDAYYFHPFEIEPFMSQFHLEKEKIAAIEGLFAQSLEKLKKFDNGLYAQWLDLAYSLLEDPATWGASDHLIYIGRKGTHRSVHRFQ